MKNPACQPFDQFTRWTCHRCGRPGFDSWNKAMHDGIDYEGDYPNPCIYGLDCNYCMIPAVIAYTTMDAAPTILYGRLIHDYSHEDAYMERLGADPSCGEVLRASHTRDADWSRGCLAAKGQMQ